MGSTRFPLFNVSGRKLLKNHLLIGESIIFSQTLVRVFVSRQSCILEGQDDSRITAKRFVRHSLNGDSRNCVKIYDATNFDRTVRGHKNDWICGDDKPRGRISYLVPNKQRPFDYFSLLPSLFGRSSLLHRFMSKIASISLLFVRYIFLHRCSICFPLFYFLVFLSSTKPFRKLR